VGDEVILTWQKQKGLNHRNVLRIVSLLNKQIELRTDYYQKYYGFIPRFRAGLHFGPVIMGELGTLKKEIALLGDTMNTTARIQSACGDCDSDLLLSQTVKEQFEEPISVDWVSLGDIALKGKENLLTLYNPNSGIT